MIYLSLLSSSVKCFNLSHPAPPPTPSELNCAYVYYRCCSTIDNVTTLVIYYSAYWLAYELCITDTTVVVVHYGRQNCEPVRRLEGTWIRSPVWLMLKVSDVSKRVFWITGFTMFGETGIIATVSWGFVGSESPEKLRNRIKTGEIVKNMYTEKKTNKLIGPKMSTKLFKDRQVTGYVHVQWTSFILKMLS